MRALLLGVYMRAHSLFAILVYLERQVAQNDRPLYPKVAHKGAKVDHNYRLLAFQVLFVGVVRALNTWGLYEANTRSHSLFAKGCKNLMFIA